MTDEYLDKFLLTLLQKEHGQAWKQDLLRFTDLSDTDDFDPAIRFLNELGHVHQERPNYDYLLTITTKGKRFIQTGGFRAESQRTNAAAEANIIARNAKTIAIWAIVVSALVALFVCYVEFVH